MMKKTQYYAKLNHVYMYSLPIPQLITSNTSGPSKKIFNNLIEICLPHLMYYIRGFLKVCQTYQLHKVGSTPKCSLRT